MLQISTDCYSKIILERNGQKIGLYLNNPKIFNQCHISDLNEISI